jgi:ComF family protein
MIQALLDLIYPRLCLVCERGLLHDELHVCMQCEYNLPKTNCFKLRQNEVYALFRPQAEISFAGSSLYFKKGGGVQELLHHIKYKDNANLARYLSALFAGDVAQFLEDNRFEIDCLVPVPIHRKKKRKRGYNQSEMISEGLAIGLKVPIESKVLQSARTKSSQTRKSRFDRWLNTSNAFRISDYEKLEGKHVLLVDDVITTGSTILRCIDELQQIPGIKISVYSLAVADSL